MDNQSDSLISPGDHLSVSTSSDSKSPHAPNTDEHTLSKDAVKKFLGTGLRYLVPLGISIGLILWLFHKVNYHEVMKIIHEGVNFWWIVAMMLLTMLSHMIRGVRWGFQLRAAGIKRMPRVEEWVTIWGAYALNLLFPELGEAWRCVFVSRRQKAPLSTVIGTDIGDRGSDLVMVIALLVLALFVAHPFLMDFLHKYSFGREIDDITADPFLWIGLGVAVAGFWTICHFFKTVSWVQKLNQNLNRIWDGFKVIFTMKKWWLYIILTFAIWTCYYLQTYLCFFAFPFTRQLISDPHMAYGLIPGLVVFVFGSVSIGVPSNGGLGPWNLAVMFALTLFGLSSVEGTAYSVVVWSFQAMMIIANGLFAAAYVMITGKKAKKAVTNTVQ